MINFDAQFFDKHQKTLLFVANRWYLNWLLGFWHLPKELRNTEVVGISPSYFDNRIDESHNIRHNFTRPRFAEALTYSLSPFAYVANARQTKMVWRFSPMGVLGCLLLALFPHKLGGFAFIGTTTSYYGGSSAGLAKADLTVWSTTRSATSASSMDSSDYCDVGILSGLYSGKYYIYRSPLPFVTNLNTGQTVTAATLYAYTIKNGGTDTLAYLVPSAQASTSTIGLSDFGVTFSSLGTIDITNTTATYNSVALSSYSVITSGANTFLALISKKDYENTAPSAVWDQRAGIYYSHYTGTSRDPYLSVTYNSGTAYTKAITETIDPSDTKTTKQTAKKITETVDPTDIIRKSGTKRILETLSIRDIYAMSKVLLKLLTERLSFLDALSIKQTGKGIKESLSLTASVSGIGTKTKALTEHITLAVTQVVGKMFNRSVLENITARDTISNAFAMGRRLVERVGLVERFYGKKNGINMKYLKKYAEKTGTYLKKYFDI